LLVLLSAKWAAALVAVIGSALALSPLFWTIGENITPLSANSEFFAFSWIYALRWGAGENVFLPHSQVTLPIFSLINKSLQMTDGSADQIIKGWHSISFYWPLMMMGFSLSALFLTIGRTAALTNCIVSSAIFLVSIPLFLTDFALSSLAYHSFAIPLAIASLAFWRQYETQDPPSAIFFVLLGGYTAICALEKPTFAAFAVPFFAMELLRAIHTKSVVGLITAASTALILYLGWLLFFYGSTEGVFAHFTKLLYFMQSQAQWYDAEKGATPLHWYAGYVVGKMGPIPTILILIAFGSTFFRGERLTVLTGISTAVACALFVLYKRSQIHGHSEFMALLTATAIAAFRLSELPERLTKVTDRYAVAVSIAAIATFIAMFPLPMIQHGFSNIMSEYDAIAVPAIFQQPENIRTIALMKYPNVMWGVADAWCRGSGNIFDAKRSDLIDSKFGNVTCLLNQENAAIDIKKFNYAVLVKPSQLSEAQNLAELLAAFPSVSSRLKNCRSIGVVKSDEDKSEFFRCELIFD
jgi:hypothetical protein